MRGTFLDNDKKRRDSKRSGSGSEKIFKPRWPLYTKLEFLKKSISCSPSVSNLLPTVQCLSSQFENEKENQDPTLQTDNIENPSQQTCIIDKEMQYYFDKNSKVISYNLN